MSRLLENSQQIRKDLEARNLYTPNDPYNLDNRQLVNTVNALASIIKPFSSFDLSNTIVGRLIGQPTPIAQIGLTMLAKQFAATVASNASTDFLPSIKFENLFDGDPDTKFIMRKQDFQITRRETQTNIGRILESLSGVKDYFNTGNPFDVDVNSEQYIRNSGKGQLQIYVENIDRNLYKIEDSGINGAITDTGLQLSLGTTDIATRIYYPIQDGNLRPFSQYLLQNANLANNDQILNEITFLLSNDSVGTKEYGNNQTYLDALGKTFIRDNSDGGNNYNFQSENFGLNDNANEQLVWGRDGAEDYYKESLGDLIEDDGSTNPRFDSGDKFGDFGIETGLLNYTRNLLNAKGKYGSFDLTRKKFQDTKEQLHFNGSPLDTEPDGTTKNYSRRHSMADPCDRYAKAIRFNGNEVYNGNQDSVIFKSVIPKFAPSLARTATGGVIDNRNLMFSLENLAVQTHLTNEGIGVIDGVDEQISIPACEVGQNGGRLMWFPPYDVRLSEQAVASWNSNQFIGRGEPIYTYNNSERLATLSFKLLMDYPPQLLNYVRDGENNFHKKVSEFFAFGGDPSPQYDTNLAQKEAKLVEKKEELRELKPTKIFNEPNITFPDQAFFLFPNDYPKQAGSDPNSFSTDTDVQSIIDLGYEDGISGSSEVGGVDNGLNVPFIENYTGLETVIAEYFNPNDNSKYNDRGEPYLFIAIEAGATALFNSQRTGISEETYNFNLSKRRQLAVKDYLEKLIFDTFGRTADQLNITIDASDELARGSSQASDDNDSPETIDTITAKKERYARIFFGLSGAVITKTEEIVGGNNTEQIDALNEEIRQLESQITTIKRRMVEFSPCVFEQPTEENGYEKGFRPMFNGRFNPVFHTQTPEDFHRRLTFLQQCTRQGAAIRVPIKGKDGNTVLSSKNSVFGRQPVCVLRFGDFFHTKVVIDNISFSYDESTWDLNPEGHGMQPMIAEISMQLKVIGGQSLRTPVDTLQNAVSFNYYANSTFTSDGVNSTATNAETEQLKANRGDGGLDPLQRQELDAVIKESSFTLPEIQKINIPDNIQ